MSAPVSTAPSRSVAATGEERRSRALVVLVLAVAAFVLLALIRTVTGAQQLTSSGTLAATLTAAMPIALAGLGGLWSERAGVVNIGLEGMMILGTFGAGFYGYNFGTTAGIFGAIAFGMIGGLLHALATVVFGVDHIVSGVAINIIATGVAGFLAESLFSDLPGGGPTQSPELPAPWTINLDFISGPMGSLEDKHWFLISDLAALVVTLTHAMPVLTLIALVLIFGSFFALWRTRFGLRLRSCGEAPAAAESLGINVYLHKFIAVIISGGMAGFAGAYLAMVASSGFQVGQTGGRGYIGLAAMIFGNWRPTGLFLGSSLFGYTQALPFRNGPVSMHALLLFIAVLLLAVAVWQLVRRRVLQGVLAAVFAGLFLLWFALTDVVPKEFTTMSPYVTTLLVLALTSQRLRMPKADGLIYRKGSAG